MPPRRNTRPADNPHPLPHPGFQTVLNSLLAQRDATLGVMVPSQPIARWESSSQPEILWELLAERRRAGVPPSLSQEQNAAVEAALAHIPPAVINDTIVEMETAVTASQGGSPALTVVSDDFWNALQAVLPASGIPTIVMQGPAFQETRRPSASGGSSPMDTSSDGILAQPPHSPSLITPLPALGDIPTAPIILSSDSETPTPVAAPPPPLGGHAATDINEHTPASPSLSAGVVAATPSDGVLMESDAPSNVTPIDSVSSWGRDAGHPLELSSDPSVHSSLRSSEIPDVPDMGSARRGGRISTGKVTDALEGASPALLARARYLNVVPARDTRSSDSEPATRPKEANVILRKFAMTDLNDGTVFTYDNMNVAHEEAITTLQGATDELSGARLGFAHYYLRDPLTLVEDPSVPVESEYLRKMADVVGAVLCGGPCSASESNEDVYSSILPGDWFRLATFMTAAITRGCIRSTNLAKKGAFAVEPCKDDFTTNPSVTTPATQGALLQAMAAQIMEELQPNGALMPQDSIDGLRATIWRAHEGQIRAWTEKEVLSVYSRLSDICLSDIMDKLEAEAPIEQITDAMREEIAEETRGKFLGLIAQEKTRAYEAALSEARAEALKEALAQGKEEAAQKGRSYEKMQLDRAEEEARLEAACIFKKRLTSAHDKMSHQVDSEICLERDQILAERRSTLEAGLVSMDWDARVDHIRSLAVQVGLLEDSHPVEAKPPKRAEPARTMTAPKVTSEAAKFPTAPESAATITRFIESSAPGVPAETSPLEPSPCPAAGEDVPAPRVEVSHMDWAEDVSEDLPPLPIDFDSKERSSSSSIHCAANAMVDDSDDVVMVSSFRDPDSGALALTPTPEPSPTPANPPSEVAQLFNLIMDTIHPIQLELKRIGDKVDGCSALPPVARVPDIPTKAASARVTPARTSPLATRPTSMNPPPTQRVDDEAQESGADLGDDADFPSLSSSNNCKARYRHKAAADREARNALVPGAPAPVQRNPTSGYVRAPPIFASVLTKSAMGAHASATDKAQTARAIQKCNPSGKLKPGHSIAPLGFTEVVVTRNGGLDDLEAEEAFRRKAPVDIVQAAQRALYKASRNPPLILRGRWTENVAKTGNFVYRLAGDIPLPTLLACKDQLCEPFPAGDVWIVPTKGWTWVQLRGVDVSYLEDDVDYVYEGAQLLAAFAANPCFQGADIMVPPHFQGNPSNFSQRTATVIAAISDLDNTCCQRASAEGVCMFGRQVKFIRAGDSPSLVQCSRCHQVGHYFSSPKCRLPPGDNKCFRCGGPHHSDNHDFECTGTHAVQGVCNCPKKCILCKGSGHMAWEKACPRRGDFAPPRLLKPAPVKDSQGVDSRMVAPPAVSRAKARTLPSGKGKEVAKAGSVAEGVAHALQEAALSVPEGICAKLGVYDLLCFCCPMPDTETFRKRYILEQGTDTVCTSLGKSIIDLHSEFVAQKAAQEPAIRAAQVSHSKIFHQDEELAAVIAQCEHQKGALAYGPIEDPADDWIRNMPLEDQIGEVTPELGTVATADAELREWKEAKASGSSCYGWSAVVCDVHVMG
jgi:hypothetical protein